MERHHKRRAALHSNHQATTTPPNHHPAEKALTARVERADGFQARRPSRSAGPYLEIPGRGHAPTIDHGSADVASAALEFIKRFT
jgi:hypothetical protein